MDKLKAWFFLHKVTAILGVVILIIVIGGFIAFQKIASQPTGPVEEVDLIFDAEGPFALLFPRRDGNALVLNLKRTSSYDSISFELAYTSTPDEKVVTGGKISEDGEGEVSGSIDRGVVGDIDTKDKKGEYEQEILFGSCSKNVCKYDKGVENGTLTLRIKKGNKAFKMITQWHLQKPDVALGSLTSGDGHLVYAVEGDRQVLSNIGFTIINDLTGVPKLPSGKSTVGKIYSLNAPIAKGLSGGAVSLELAENPPAGAKLFRYNQNKSEWQELDTKIEGSKLSAKAEGAGIFTVLVNK
ncbi:hypothetical protein A3J19_05550 [Candidatus Daviesbacteria bacterium RIFCSPLOWO2_02_FULL_41_8]|uniref:Uncharacterized protein n=3 Tax=Candidatus Daviesiibacteriota TaxID=1752718 RepID=A0A1F5NIB5_9BACT|nr:MAG: hypothetical protein A2871_03555 [Candidatus Daviesbacteria bacterium RIFCSPHIGHO2_01_FULL_41_23]OGE32475.1 MAG: hypothetical protein A3D83_02400 [Candidatus Daviesbacteria bacterium RIFCSPHIGHO2_02_FULL_41_10]OGE61996.1 MAG: hypothetical protein A2967_03370 [Candidatus Daviesbacteria bacterium RIFCSPLOWO2_01_FULL_41_32]OGE77375.1 MAG: hypothetical protein A3J19_05550 [Candidatus Daviesbacteria bacterium RIFCSPLOWO2_02_FULL_41_8]